MQTRENKKCPRRAGTSDKGKWPGHLEKPDIKNDTSVRIKMVQVKSGKIPKIS